MKRTIVLQKERTTGHSNVQRLLTVLFQQPDTEFSLTQLARTAGIAKSAVSRLLPTITAANIALVRSIGTTHCIKAHTDHFSFVKRKIAWNLTAIYESSLIEYLDEHYHHPKAIILFGSFRSGQDIVGSDIDIAIETTERIDTRTERIAALQPLEDQLHRSIQVHLFNRDTVDTNVFSNIANGIVLLGYLEVLRG